MSSYGSLALLYDKLIYEDVDYKKYGEFITHICDKHSINRRNYLDLACGTGNLSVELGAGFRENYVLDLSTEMLSEAESKFRSRGLKAKFICQNIVSLNLNKKFDLITCCLDSTNYILEEDELESYFSGVYNHLDKDGIFIFDINSYYKIKNVLGNNTFTYDNDEVYYIWQNYFEDEIVDMCLTFFVKEDGHYNRFDECHTERAYKLSNLVKLIKNTGFEVITICENYEEDKILDEENEPETERITFVVKKTLKEKLKNE